MIKTYTIYFRYLIQVFIRIGILVLMAHTAIFAEDTKITIYYSNNTNGYLENCYCPKRPLGSLEKRAAFLEQKRTENKNIIVFDTGDFLTVSGDSYKDSLVCEAYRKMRYDGILPGDQELVRPDNHFSVRQLIHNTDFILSNLEEPGTIPFKIIERDGIKIGILGIFGGNAVKYYPEADRSKLTILDPVKTYKRLKHKFRDQVDIMVMLTHQGYDHDLRLAAEISDLDIILGSHSQTVVKNPEDTNGVLVAQAGKNGFYLGKIEIILDEDKNIVSKTGELIPMTQEMPDHPFISKLIQEFEVKTGVINPRKMKYKK